MADTLQDLRNITYGILKSEEGDNAYPVVLVDKLINTVIEQSIGGLSTEYASGNVVPHTNLTFLEENAYYDTVQDSTLTAEITSDSTEISMTTTSFYDSGYVYINGNIIQYTGKTDTELTGVTGIKGSFIGGTKVKQAYELPSDYLLATNIYIAGTKSDPIDYRMDTEYFRQSSEDDGEGVVYTPKHMLVQGKYLITTNTNSTTPIRLDYQKKADELVNLTDETIVPSKYSIFIGYMTAGELEINRGEIEEGYRLNSIGIKYVRAMFRGESMQTKSNTFGGRIKTASDEGRVNNNYNNRYVSR